ncbi:MAG: lipase family protein [Gallionellaceae bacterium]|nr:lipase family protein [Gallionellaceae bacterium]
MQTDTSWQDLLHPGDATDFFLRRPFPVFDPTTPAYSPINALWLAELSRLVYRHDAEEDVPPPLPTRTHFLEHAGFTQRQFFHSKETGTQAMLVESGGTLPFTVLVFRGTEQSVKDYLTDLEFGELSLDRNKKEVHAGFMEALDSVWRDMAAAIARLNSPIFYTGHSMGAALATLAAARHAPSAVYTFGSPRVGNQAFVASLNNVPIYRIVDDEDIVTTVPSESLGFRHVGTELRLSSHGQALSLNRVFGPPKPLADHAPINYVDRI